MSYIKKNYGRLVLCGILVLMFSFISIAYAEDADEGGVHTHDYSVKVGSATHEAYNGGFRHKQVWKCKSCSSTQTKYGAMCSVRYEHDGTSNTCKRNYYCSDCNRNARYDDLTVSPSYDYRPIDGREHSVYYTCPYCKKDIVKGSENHVAGSTAYAKNDGSTHIVNEVCKFCSYNHAYNANHNYGSYSYSGGNSTTHNKSRTCINCSYVQSTSENHELEKGVSMLDKNSANYSTKHKTFEACKYCGYQNTYDSNHSYGAYKYSNPTKTGHTKTRSCSCGYVQSSTENHNNKEEYEELDANNHTKKMVCQNCNYTETTQEKHDILTEEESIDKNRHSIITSCQLCTFRVEETEAHKKVEKTEEINGKKYKIVYCSICDEEISREALDGSSEPTTDTDEPNVTETPKDIDEPHVHNFNGQVTYKTTANGHIKIVKCTGCMVTKQITDKEEKHTFGIPYFDSDYDEEHLTYTTLQTKHYKNEACKVCNYVRRTLENHIFGEPVTRPATQKTSGSTTWTCPCGYVKKEIIPKLGNNTSLRLPVGSSFMPEADYVGITWNISNSKLAHKLSDGRVFCDAIGNFTVTGIKGDKTVATYNVEVYDPGKTTHNEATVTILTEEKSPSKDLPLVVYFGGAGQGNNLEGALEGISREQIYKDMEGDILVPTYTGNDNKAVTQNVSEAMAIIDEYLNNPDLKGRPLYIDGHSNGGHGAILLAELAAEHGIEVKELVLADANWTKGEYSSAGERLANLAKSNPSIQIYNYACPHAVGAYLPNETTSHLTYRAASTQGLTNLHNGVLKGENSGHPAALAKTLESMNLIDVRNSASILNKPSNNYLSIYSNISNKESTEITVSGVQMSKVFSDTTSKNTSTGSNSKHEIIYSLDKNKVTTVIFGGTDTNPETTMSEQEQKASGFKANNESVMYIQSFGGSDSHQNEHNKELAREAVKELVNNGIKTVNAVGLSQGGYYVLAFYEACQEAGISVNGAVFADAVPKDLIVDGKHINPVDELIDTGLPIAIITTSDKTKNISQSTRETADKYADEANVQIIQANGGHSTAQYEISDALSSMNKLDNSGNNAVTTDIAVLDGISYLKEEVVCVESSHKSKWEITYSNINDKTHNEHYYCKTCNIRWTLKARKHDNKDVCQCGYSKKDETTIKAESLHFRVAGITINEGETRDLKSNLEVYPSNADTSKVQYSVIYAPEGLSISVSNKGIITYTEGSGTAIVEAYDVKSKLSSDIAVIVKESKKNTENKTSVENFSDVLPNDWYYDQVKKAIKENIIKGTSNTTFDPNGKLTLGDSVTLLGRLDTLTTATEKEGYQNLSEDVSDDMYYAPMMAWANTQGLISRDNKGNYNPQEVASREWQANVIYNYFKTFYPSAVQSLKLEELNYNDKDSISSDYSDAIKAMQKLKIMIGDENNNFNPQQTLTRAEMATIISRIEDIITMTLDGNLDIEEGGTTTTTASSGSHSYSGPSNNPQGPTGGSGSPEAPSESTPSEDSSSWDDYAELPPLPMMSGDTYYKESMFFGRAVLRPGAGNPQFSNAEWANYERILSQRVRMAGWGTRAGAVEAALFLTSLPYAVPYRGTPMNPAQGQGAYYHVGLNNTWGRRVPLKVTVTTSKRTYQAGGYYLNGLDCGGFVNWVMINGGVKPESFRGMQSTKAYGKSNRDLENLPDYKNQVRPGDLAFTMSGSSTTHIGIVVGVSQKYVYIAESSGCVQTQRYGKNDSSWWILPMSYSSEGVFSVVDWS